MAVEEWRRANPAGTLDLRGLQSFGLYLAELDLSGADLTGADLAGACLRRCILRGAKLRDAKLFGADLSYADFSNADLTGADLFGAVNCGSMNLQGTKLEGCKMFGVALSRDDEITNSTCSAGPAHFEQPSPAREIRCDSCADLLAVEDRRWKRIVIAGVTVCRCCPTCWFSGRHGDAALVAQRAVEQLEAVLCDLGDLRDFERRFPLAAKLIHQNWAPVPKSHPDYEPTRDELDSWRRDDVRHSAQRILSTTSIIDWSD
jgi:uncharacterized protein YjbI with pentapeptide repeats